MRLLSQVAIETVDVEQMEVPVGTWGERGGGIAFTEDVNKSENGGEEDEAITRLEDD